MKKILISGLFMIMVMTISVISFRVYVEKVDARCGSRCQAQRIADRIWNNFASKATSINNSMGSSGGSSGGSSRPYFGGRIAFTLFCTCNSKTAFIIMPVPGSQAGPYAVSWFGSATGQLKAYWSVLVGNNVLGKADVSSTCNIRVAAYCFSFNVTDVNTAPGMGTSMGG